ncbi:MAG: aspartate aminotransferase family protein [Halobacteriota archaeon]
MTPHEREPAEAGSVLPHWHSPGSEPLTIERGSGSRVYDADGTEYLDFLSQLYCVNAGHGNEAINGAIRDQLERIAYVSSAKHNDVRSELATRIADVAPLSGAQTFFAISGSEANEAAMQMARAYTDSPTVLTRWRSYHGGSYGTASVAGDVETRTNVERYASTTGSARFLPPLPQCFDADGPEELAEQAANHLEFVIRNEGADAIAAILTEPIGGTSGAYPAPPGYFTRVRELCDEYDILLISDEVITGFGRCGEWFGIETEGVEPDLLTFAKGITSAYVPLAGVVASGDVADHFRQRGIPVGQTFAGHPIACAAGVAALDEYENGLIDNVRALAPTFEEALGELGERHAAVGDVRGRGFHWSVEFRDPDTDEPFVDPWVDDGDNPVEDVRAAARDRGVLFGSGRPDVQCLLSPPLCTDEDDVRYAVDVLDASITAAFD